MNERRLVLVDVGPEQQVFLLESNNPHCLSRPFRHEELPRRHLFGDLLRRELADFPHHVAPLQQPRRDL